MTCDSLMLRRMVTELRAVLGRRVQRVFPLGRVEYVVELAGRQPGGQIVLSANPDLPRLYRADDLEPSGAAETPLAAVLRRHLRGATLTGVEQLAFDRVVRLQFANCEGLGPQARRFLILEISGRHSNLLLLDEGRTILECARHVTARVNRVCQSLPGEPYAPPPDFGKLNPLTVTAADLANHLPPTPQPLEEWLRATLQGGSDLFLAAVRAEAHVAETTTGLDEAGRESLAAALERVLGSAATEGPGFVLGLPGGRLQAYPRALPGAQVLGELPSLSAAVAVVHERQVEYQQSGQLRQRLTACLQSAREKARRCETARERSLAEAAGAEKVRRLGDLLLGHLHELTPGQPEAALADWETGKTVTVALDPGLTPQEQAQRYFSRYKKLQRVLQQVPPLLAAARAERQDYEDLLDQVEEASLAELRLIEEELRERGLLSRAKQARTPVKVDYRRAETSDGLPVLYGRSALENAAVLRAASPDDLWFHVQGAPGGHVVIRTNNHPEAVPPGSLLDAARLAARQSLRRREATVAVDYTLVKHLTRTRGAAPGHVVYREFKTLLVRPRD